MENAETTREGALRETWEEACARVDDVSLYRLFDVPYISQVYMFYRGQLRDGQCSAGPESEEVALFAEQDIPWGQIAFPIVSKILKEYFADTISGNYPIRVSAIGPVDNKPPGV